jgi:hypothetical protein
MPPFLTRLTDRDIGRVLRMAEDSHFARKQLHVWYPGVFDSRGAVHRDYPPTGPPYVENGPIMRIYGARDLCGNDETTKQWQWVRPAWS